MIFGAPFILMSPAVSTAPWTPASIPSVIGWIDAIPENLWQDTARASPVTTAGQAAASAAVLNATGAAYAEQTSAASRPAYQLDANGRGHLLFDGSNDWLRISSLLLEADASIFVVAQNRDQTLTGSIHRPIFAAADVDNYVSTGTHYGFGVSRGNADAIRTQLGEQTTGSGDLTVTHIVTANDANAVFGMRRSGGITEIYLNGSEVASGTGGRMSGISTDNYALGGNPPQFVGIRVWRGRLYTAIFAGAMTSSDIASLQGWGEDRAGMA